MYYPDINNIWNYSTQNNYASYAAVGCSLFILVSDLVAKCGIVQSVIIIMCGCLYCAEILVSWGSSLSQAVA